MAFPAQGLAVVVLANLDDETGRVSYQSIAHGIAGLVDPALAYPRFPASDADPSGEGATMLDLMKKIGDGKASEGRVNARWLKTLPPPMLKGLSGHLATVKSVVRVTCDDVHVPGWESFGMVVKRDCVYRVAGPEPETVRAEWAADGTLVSISGE
jgi:hypothetical protein